MAIRFDKDNKWVKGVTEWPPAKPASTEQVVKELVSDKVVDLLVGGRRNQEGEVRLNPTGPLWGVNKPKNQNNQVMVEVAVRFRRGCNESARAICEKREALQQAWAQKRVLPQEDAERFVAAIAAEVRVIVMEAANSDSRAEKEKPSLPNAQSVAEKPESQGPQITQADVTPESDPQIAQAEEFHSNDQPDVTSEEDDEVAAFIFEGVADNKSVEEITFGLLTSNVGLPEANEPPSNDGFKAYIYGVFAAMDDYRQFVLPQQAVATQLGYADKRGVVDINQQGERKAAQSQIAVKRELTELEAERRAKVRQRQETWKQLDKHVVFAAAWDKDDPNKGTA